MTKHKQKGISIIEVSVSLAIIGILSAIVIPVYFSYANEVRLSGALPVIGELEKRVADYRHVTSNFIWLLTAVFVSHWLLSFSALYTRKAWDDQYFV